MERVPEPEYMDDAGEAEAYAVADFSEVNQAFVDRLIDVARGIENAAAVDLGTGPGDIPIRVVRARAQWRVTGVDASAAMLAIAEAAACEAGVEDRIQWVAADAKETDLPSAAFDVVFSNSILHHITDTGSFWREVRRLCRPGGVVFIRDLARPAGESAAWEIVEKNSGQESELLKQEFFRSLLSAYTVEEVRAQLDDAGLSGLSVRTVTDRHLDVWGRLS